MIGKSIRSDDNFGSVLHRRHTTLNSSAYGNPIEVRSGALRGCRWAWFLASAVGRPPSLTLAQGATQASWLAPMASRSPPLAGWLRHPFEARTAREEAEVNETWQVVGGIATDW